MGLNAKCSMECEQNTYSMLAAENSNVCCIILHGTDSTVSCDYRGSKGQR